jgi:DNA gyrase subunit B
MDNNYSSINPVRKRGFSKPGKDAFSNGVKDQFKLRAASFERSARWVRDEGLLSLHRSLAGVYSGNLILDVCCGIGMVGEKFLGDGVMVVGLDISLPMLARAKERLSYCVNAPACLLPFRNELFDVVVCRQAFHFLNPKRAIKEMYRIAKPGARLVVSQIVPFGREDSEWLYCIHREKQPSLRNFLHDKDITALLEEAGCTDISFRDCYLEESVDNWLSEPFFSQATREKIKKMFLQAPPGYRRLHNTRVLDGQIFDTMRWHLARGIKHEERRVR